MSQQEPEIVLTQRGHEKLEARLEHLRNVSRREVADRIRDSKQFGDLTENAEYEDAKTEQALIESQITELRRVLQIAQLMETDEIPTDYVGLGSIVKLINLSDDEEWECTLVTPVEADPDIDFLSNESPVGQAIMGKKVGDKVSIRVPDGMVQYEIASIRK